MSFALHGQDDHTLIGTQTTTKKVYLRVEVDIFTDWKKYIF